VGRAIARPGSAVSAVGRSMGFLKNIGGASGGSVTDVTFGADR
jgi:hypothetical protein